MLGDLARETDSETDWGEFRRLRNSCTANQRKDKASFHREIFKGIEDTNDSAELFGMTRKTPRMEIVRTPHRIYGQWEICYQTNWR